MKSPLEDAWIQMLLILALVSGAMTAHGVLKSFSGGRPAAAKAPATLPRSAPAAVPAAPAAGAGSAAAVTVQTPTLSAVGGVRKLTSKKKGIWVYLVIIMMIVTHQ